MHFQLFIPEGKAQDPQMLVDVGLADFVAGADFMPNQQGPEDLMGAVIAWQKPGKVGIGYLPEKQTWIPALPNGPDGAGKGRYWVGLWNDDPVKPEDLQRVYSHPGEHVELGDGNQWRFPELEQLPKDLILADDGTWKFELQRQYHDLWLESEQWLQRVSEPVDFGLLADFVVRCLAQNYRVVPEFVSHVRLFNNINIQRAFGALLRLEVVA